MKKITIYTTDYCPYCHKAKAVLKNKGLTFEEIDISNNEEEMRARLEDITGGYRTVPQIFVGTTRVGGFDDLEEQVKSGEFEKIING